MLRRASATAVFAMLLLPALAASSSKVLLSGETLHQRSLPEFVVLPDFSLLQLAKIRFLCPGARPDETLVYDLGGGSVERYRGQTPSAVLERKSYRIPYLSIRDAELPIFYAPNAEDLASDNTVDQPGVLVFVGDRPYFTRPRPVPKDGPGSTTSTTTATTAPSSTITTTPSSTTTTTTTAFACTTAHPCEPDQEIHQGREPD
jgi:hypothetical protein